MINLDKPIRRKSDGMRMIYWGEAHAFTLEPDRGLPVVVSLDQLERDYENIPEPRKPRDFVAVKYRDGSIGYPVKNSGGVVIPCGVPQSIDGIIRLIEWPKGVPLPDYPEGT